MHFWPWNAGYGPTTCYAAESAVTDTFRSGHTVKATGPGKPGRTWYLPYHSVRNPNKPQKISVVYNTAARHRGVALNDVFREGPDLTTQLLAVLLRRAASCDIN